MIYGDPELVVGEGMLSPSFSHPILENLTSAVSSVYYGALLPVSAITISVLLIIGGVEVNPGPGSTSDEEICPIEIDCTDDTFESSETLQRTPISSQLLPMTSLDLSNQCSSDVSMTPEKNFSTPKSRKRKGYRARKERNRANIKKRRVDDGPTFVCCCCGCLHFRRSVVVLTKTRLDSMSDTTFINQVCYNFIISNLI